MARFYYFSSDTINIFTGVTKNQSNALKCIKPKNNEQDETVKKLNKTFSKQNLKKLLNAFIGKKYINNNSHEIYFLNEAKTYISLLSARKILLKHNKTKARN